MAARKPHKHRRGKGRLGKVIQLLFVLALLGAMTVGATVFFQVEQVVVTGNNRYTQEEIVAATGIQTGDNLFRMNKFAIQDHVLEEMPYLEDILIRRKLPSTITVAECRLGCPGAGGNEGGGGNRPPRGYRCRLAYQCGRQAAGAGPC